MNVAGDAAILTTNGTGRASTCKSKDGASSARRPRSLLPDSTFFGDVILIFCRCIIE